MYPTATGQRGFTLIELSIVLVIIGLIVGGVLAGRDLIRAAEVCATISQIENYNTAANTFYGKYGALPGDMNAATAAQFGFLSRAGTPGRGDGNGLLEAYDYLGGYVQNGDQGGEVLFLWEDLSSANLIEGTFNRATDAALPGVADFLVTPGRLFAAVFCTEKSGRNLPVQVLVRNREFCTRRSASGPR